MAPLAVGRKAPEFVLDTDRDIPFRLSEQSGLPVDVEEACDELVRIPMAGRAESLNLAIAAGVMIYEAWRAQGFGRAG